MKLFRDDADILLIGGTLMFIFSFPLSLISGLGSALMISGAILLTGGVICEFIKNSHK